MIVLYVVLVLIAALVAVIIARTIKFKPLPEEKVVSDDVNFDRDAAENALAELIRCRTVSNENHELEDDAEFEKLIGKLPGLYPHVFETCPLQRMDDRGLLFHWKGKGDG